MLYEIVDLGKDDIPVHIHNGGSLASFGVINHWARFHQQHKACPHLRNNTPSPSGLRTVRARSVTCRSPSRTEGTPGIATKLNATFVALRTSSLLTVWISGPAITHVAKAQTTTSTARRKAIVAVREKEHTVAIQVTEYILLEPRIERRSNASHSLPPIPVLVETRDYNSLLQARLLSLSTDTRTAVGTSCGFDGFRASSA